MRGRTHVHLEEPGGVREETLLDGGELLTLAADGGAHGERRERDVHDGHVHLHHLVRPHASRRRDQIRPGNVTLFI